MIQSIIAETGAEIDIEQDGTIFITSVKKEGLDAAEAKINMLTKEFEVGFNIVLKALEAPLKQIAVNAGKDDGSVIVERVRNGRGNAGYDALKDEMVADMVAAGIVDPVKVTRLGVENAASAAASRGGERQRERESSLEDQVSGES